MHLISFFYSHLKSMNLQTIEIVAFLNKIEYHILYKLVLLFTLLLLLLKDPNSTITMLYYIKN
jgi:hypothetical protein